MTELAEQVHVAVAVIIDVQQRVLIALRQAHQHQGNLWEFPGGKRKSDESVEQALVREIKEEVDLDIISATPMRVISHNYGDKLVLLDVWQVTQFEGCARGLEGQIIHWCPIDELKEKAFPVANQIIIDMITKKETMR